MFTTHVLASAIMPGCRSRLKAHFPSTGHYQPKMAAYPLLIKIHACSRISLICCSLRLKRRTMELPPLPLKYVVTMPVSLLTSRTWLLLISDPVHRTLLMVFVCLDQR